MSPTEVLDRLAKLDLANPFIDHKAAEAALSRAIAGMGLLPLRPVWTTDYGLDSGWPFGRIAFSPLEAFAGARRTDLQVFERAWTHFAPRIAAEWATFSSGSFVTLTTSAMSFARTGNFFARIDDFTVVSG